MAPLLEAGEFLSSGEFMPILGIFNPSAAQGKRLGPGNSWYVRFLH